MTIDPIPKLIFALARSMKGDAERSFAGKGLTLFQYAVLKSIADGLLTQNEIARALVIKAPSLVPIIGSLEAAGHVKRQNDASDRRRIVLSLTRQGSLLLKKVPPPRFLRYEKAIKALGETKRQQLTALLEELGKSI